MGNYLALALLGALAWVFGVGVFVGAVVTGPINLTQETIYYPSMVLSFIAFVASWYSKNSQEADS